MGLTHWAVRCADDCVFFGRRFITQTTLRVLNISQQRYQVNFSVFFSPGFELPVLLPQVLKVLFRIYSSKSVNIGEASA